MKDPYVVLGLAKDSSPDLLRARYKELHDLYGEQRFKSGEEGNEGARKLHELEEAWLIIDRELSLKTSSDTVYDGNIYERTDSLIRAGKYNEAQDILDSLQDRGGEWHYMQAIIFYKREWYTEAKTQLEMALTCDPANAKYKSSLDKMNLVLANPSAAGKVNDPQSVYGGSGGANPQEPYTQQPPQQDNAANCLSSCCCAYCLTDCLCSAMRCL